MTKPEIIAWHKTGSIHFALTTEQSHLDIQLLPMINKTYPFIKEGIINTGGRHEKSWDHFHPYQFYLYNP